MKTQTLKVLEVDPETGELRPRAKLSKQLKAGNLDAAMAEARAFLKKEGLKVRSINAAPGGILLAYCDGREMVTELVGGLEVKRPAKMAKRGR